jgi:hypothetical protein
MKKNELPIPQAARTDPRSREMVRAWAAENGLQCSLWIVSDPNQELVLWGILLSDIVRHVADALLKQHQLDPEQSIREIRAHFDYEFDNPTGKTNGDFVH